MVRTALIIVIWCSVMALSLGAALNSYVFFERSRPSFARLTKSSGNVQFRPSGTALWIDAARNQAFGEGDVVATDRRSQATISFVGGREFTLEGGSQVVIARNAQAKDQEFVVTLVKGALKAAPVRPNEHAKSVPGEITVRAGTKSVALKSAVDAVEIRKTPGHAPPQVRVVAGKPHMLAIAPPKVMPAENLTPGSSETALERLATAELTASLKKRGEEVDAAISTNVPGMPAISAANAPAAMEAELPVPTVTPSPAQDQASNLAVNAPPLSSVREIPTAPAPRMPAASLKITEPADGTTLWSPGSRKSARMPPVRLSLGQAGAPPSSLAPLVEVTLDRKPIKTVSAKLERGSYTVLLDAALLMPAGAQGARSDLIPERFELTPGFKGELSVKKPHSLRIGSLENAREYGVGIYLNHLKFAQGTGWIRQRGPVNARDARISLYLQSGTDLPLLAPLLRGAESFSLERKLFSQELSTMYMVRGGKIAARLDARDGIDPESLAYLRRLISGSFSFRGSGRSYHGLKIPDVSSHHIIVMHPKLRLETISQRLLNRNASAATFIEKNVDAIFSDPVEIIDPPASPTSQAIPEIKRWILSLGDRGLPKQTMRPAKLLFVEHPRASRRPKSLTFDANAFNRLGVLKALNSAQVDLALELNAQALSGDGAPQSIVQRLMALSGAEAVVFASRDSEPWNVLSSGKDGPLLIAAAPPPNSRTDPADIHRWALKTLRFQDGLILDRRDGFVLAATAASKASVGQQALAIDATSTPLGVLACVAVADGFGLFRVVLESREMVDFKGATLIVE